MNIIPYWFVPLHSLVFTSLTQNRCKRMTVTVLLTSSVPTLSNMVVPTSMAEKKYMNIGTYWQISSAVVQQNNLLEWQRK